MNGYALSKFLCPWTYKKYCGFCNWTVLNWGKIRKHFVRYSAFWQTFQNNLSSRPDIPVSALLPMSLECNPLYRPSSSSPFGDKRWDAFYAGYTAGLEKGHKNRDDSLISRMIAYNKADQPFRQSGIWNIPSYHRMQEGWGLREKWKNWKGNFPKYSELKCSVDFLP